MKKNYFITLLILCFSLSSFGQEMALNSGFEAWDDSTTPTDWTKAENITQSNDAQSGTFSALRDGGTGTKDLSQTITGVIAGDSYTISLWYKVTSGDGTDARIWSYWKDGSGGSVTDADTDGALRGPDNSYLDNNGGVWTEYTATVVAPATTEAFYFEVRSYAGSVVYWDNLSFVHNTTSSSPAIAITAPTDGATIDATTSVDVAISVTDFAVGTTDAGLDGHIHWTIQENSDAAVDQPMKYNTDAETISVTPGNSYTVYMELVDNSHAVISPAVNTSTTFTVAPAEPTDAAPTPPARETGDVVSLFSDAYTDVTLTELPTDWSDLTTFEATTVAGDNVWKLSGLEFLGMVTNYDTGIDVSTMEKLHIDYWVPTGVENELFVKIVNTIDGGEDLESLGTTVSGSWQSIDLDMTGFDGGNLANKEKITQILFDSDGRAATVYVDNFYFYKEPVVITEPTDAAPTPPARETGDVVSLFSDAYTDVTLTELPTDWSDLTTFEATTVAGDNVWKLSGLEFLGMVTNYDTGIDVSTMEKLHIDYWVPTGVENELFVKIVNTIDGGEDLESLGTTVSGSWQSIDLDMTGFDGGNLANKEKITQILFDSDGRAATVYVDNFYFYKEPVVITEPTDAAPTPPARETGDVVSLFSDAYTDVTLTELPTDWSDLTTFEATTVAGDNVWKLSGLEFLGMVTNYDTGIDVSTMEKLHIDYWVPTGVENELFVKIVNTIDGGEDLESLGTTVSGSWQSIDLDMTGFDGGNLANKEKITQILFDSDGRAATVYVDNFYFYKEPVVITEPTDAAPTPPARETGDVVSLFSDAYTDVTLTELPTDWSDLTTFEATTVAGDNVWKLSGLEFLGMVTNYDTGIDVSTMEKLHIDYWVPTGVENELFVKIVNTIDGGEDLESLGTTVSGSWQSIDLDMTGFDGGNLANKEKITQILFDSDGRAATVYVDNFYFYKEATAGIDDQDLVSLNMYPNPASDVLNISAQSTINSVEIFNVLGQKVITMQVENTSAEINVSNLNAGIYLIKYEINNSSSTKKFVKN